MESIDFTGDAASAPQTKVAALYAAICYVRALRCDEATLRRLVKALLIAEEIESPEIVDGKVTYTLSK